MLSKDVYARLDEALAGPDSMSVTLYPGDDGGRQPVHTVYVPADRVRAGLPRAWGDEALAAMDELLPDGDSLAELLDLEPAVAGEVHARVRRKLAAEPIEDLRLDFEDGFAGRDEAEEGAAAIAGGILLSKLDVPFCGIRIKGLEAATRRRGVNTLDVVLSLFKGSAAVPSGFVVTLPKVTQVEQVAAFADVLLALEKEHDYVRGRLHFEIQVETPQAVLAADGTAAVARMIDAGAGRVRGLHYGTYDYSAACGIAAPYQALDHPVADHAKAVMQLAAAGTGVRLSDGSTNVLPVGPPDAVRAAWRLHAGLVTRSLRRGFYQGWDLHPGQLVTRYAATYAFYRAGLPSAATRLRAYLAHSAKSSSDVLDEPATAQAMAALLVRGLHCGALDQDEVTERCGTNRRALDRLYRRRIG